MSVMVILTPGTGAPVESVAVPMIVPEVTCAAEGKLKISHTSKTKNGRQENSEMSRETFMVCAPFAKRKPSSPSFEAGLLGLSLFGDFFQFLLQVLLIFLLQLWVAWAGIYFAGLVFSLSELPLRPFVVDMKFVGLFEHLLYE